MWLIKFITVREKYDPIIAAIEQAMDLSSLSVTELARSFDTYEKKLKQWNEENVESAFKNKSKYKGNREGGNCKNKRNITDYARTIIII